MKFAVANAIINTKQAKPTTQTDKNRRIERMLKSINFTIVTKSGIREVVGVIAGEPLNQVILSLIEANAAHQDIISVKEATEILGIKRAWLYKLIKAGKITKYECLGKPGFSRVEILNAKLYREV